jgi:hypothetical protein
VDEDFEMIAVKVKGMDPKYSWVNHRYIQSS